MGYYFHWPEKNKNVKALRYYFCSVSVLGWGSSFILYCREKESGLLALEEGMLPRYPTVEPTIHNNHILILSLPAEMHVK